MQKIKLLKILFTEQVNTLAEHFESGTLKRESIPPSLPMETTVILTHRSKDSKTSNKSKIKNSKLSQYQQAWGVSEETAKLMLKRERIMKGQTFDFIESVF